MAKPLFTFALALLCAEVAAYPTTAASLPWDQELQPRPQEEAGRVSRMIERMYYSDLPDISLARHELNAHVRNSSTIAVTDQTARELFAPDTNNAKFPVADMGKYFSSILTKEQADTPHDVKNEFFHSVRTESSDGSKSHSVKMADDKAFKSICTIKVGCLAISAAITIDPGAEIKANIPAKKSMADKDPTEDAIVHMKGKLTFRIGTYYDVTNDGPSCNAAEENKGGKMDKGFAKTCDQGDKNCDAKTMPIVLIPLAIPGINFVVSLNSQATTLYEGDLTMNIPFSFDYVGNSDGEATVSNIDFDFQLAKAEIGVYIEFLAGISFVLQIGFKGLELGMEAWLGFDADFHLALKWNDENVAASGMSTLALSGSATLAIKAACNVYYKIGLDLKGIADAGLLLAELVISNSPIVRFMGELAELFGWVDEDDYEMCAKPSIFGWLPDWSIEGLGKTKNLLSTNLVEWSISGTKQLKIAAATYFTAEPEFKDVGAACAVDESMAARGALECVTGSCGRTGQAGKKEGWHCCYSGLSEDHSYWYCDHQTQDGEACDVNAQCISGICGRWNENGDLMCCHSRADVSLGLGRDYCNGLPDLDSCAKDGQCVSGKCGKIDQKNLGCCPDGLQPFLSTGTVDVCAGLHKKNGESCYNDEQCASGHCIEYERERDLGGPKTILSTEHYRICDWNYDPGHQCEDDEQCANDHCGRVGKSTRWSGGYQYECCRSGDFISFVSGDYCTDVNMKAGTACDYDEQCASGICDTAGDYDYEEFDRCQDRNKKNGAGCERDEECASHNCDSGIFGDDKCVANSAMMKGDKTKGLNSDKRKVARALLKKPDTPHYLPNKFGSKKKNEGVKRLMKEAEATQKELAASKEALAALHHREARK